MGQKHVGLKWADRWTLPKSGKRNGGRTCASYFANLGVVKAKDHKVKVGREGGVQRGWPLTKYSSQLADAQKSLQ